MIMAKDSNNNYVKIEDIKQQNSFNGVSPIEFKGSGENLENYRIYGNTIDDKNVGDRIENLFDKENIQRGAILAGNSYAGLSYSESVVHYAYGINYDINRLCFKQLLTVTGINTISISGDYIFMFVEFPNGINSGKKSDWYSQNTPLTIEDKTFALIIKHADERAISDADIENIELMINKGSTALPYEPYYYRVPVTVEGKNLVPNTATSQTINGVTFTVNNDGSVTCNGTSTSQYYSLFRIPCYLVAGNYTISGCPVGGGSRKYRADIRISPNGGMVGGDADTGAGVTIPIDESGWYDYTIRIQGGYTVDDVTFKPMIRKADIEDDTYEPYHAPVTTPIYLPEQIRKVGDEAEYIDYGEQKMHRVRKNLLQNTATSQTINGVTFTVNNDGSITCNGTVTASTPSVLYIPFTLPIKLYELSGCPDSGSNSTYRVDIRNIDYSMYKYNGNTVVDDGTGCLFDGGNNQYCIRIAPGYTCNNLTFYPMIRKADIEDDTYEPYIINTELDITLPALPTLSGTNTLSVGTEITPSKVWGRLSDPRDIEYVKDNLGNILFSKYHEVENVPPLTYKAIEGTLKNYRIYGNTVGGESVVDKTGNLFDKSGSQYGNNLHWVPPFSLVYSDTYYGSPIMDVTGLNTITRSYTGTGANYFSTSDLSQFVNVSNIGTVDAGVTVNVPDGYTKYVFNIPNTIRPDSIMVNSGSTALPYEPYSKSVGDRTENLFDGEKFAETAYPTNATVKYSENSLIFTPKVVDAYVNWVYSQGSQGNVPDELRPSCIDVLPSTTYTISMSSTPKCYISWLNSSYQAVSKYTRIPIDQSSYTFTTPRNCTKLLIRLGKEVNNIGDKFTISNIMLNVGSEPLPYEPYGYRIPVTTERSVPHTATLQLHDCLPSTMQFDAPEALYYAENGLVAGTYCFTIQNYDTASGGGKTYHFTLTHDVPVGGQLTFGWSYNTQAINAKITSYVSNTSTTVIEQVSVSEGSVGIDLGTTDGNSTNVNHIHRVRYGSNNYKESAIRQFLNSSAVAGSVWTPQTKYDRPPSWNSNTAGFMKDIDSDFLAVLGASPKVVALNTATDGGGSVTINNDKFFLLSRSEVYGGKENNINEGEPYPYYSNYSDLPAAGAGEDSNRIKYRSGTAQVWWLRSPYSASGGSVRLVNASGGVNNSNHANYSGGVAPACNIALDEDYKFNGQVLHVRDQISVQKGNQTLVFDVIGIDHDEVHFDKTTTNLYLPEQIKMVGNKAEYIDFGEQKQHRVRVNLFEGVIVNGSFSPIEGTLTSTETRIRMNGDNFIYLVPGTYTINASGVDRVVYYNYSEADISTYAPSGSYVNWLSLPCTFEVTNASYFLFGFKFFDDRNISPSNISNIMLNAGSEPLPDELDVTLPALPTVAGMNILSVGTQVQPSKINIKGKIKGKIYGWHVDPDISDSSNAVTYLEDAIGMTPASMGSTTFDYGSWENAFFMPKPCMLKSNGKVDYYLDPNDYTKKLNGTASDISNPNYDGNAMMEWPKIWFKYVKGVKEGQGYFYVANYKADGNFHCWCNYDSENNEIDHFYTAIYNGTSFANYDSSKTYVINDFAIYDNKLYKCNTDIATAESFDNTKWDLVSNTAPAIDKMRSLSDIRLTNNNGNGQTTTTTETTRATANNTTSAAEWYIETFSDRLLINGLLVLMGKSLNTQAVFGMGLNTGGQYAKEAYVTGTLNDKGLFWGVTENGNSGVKVFGMENYWGCVYHRIAGLIINNHAVKLKLTYGTKDGSTVVGYNQTGNGYIDNGTASYSNGYVQKMSYNKYGFMPAVVTYESQSTYYADYHDYYYQNVHYAETTYALFGGDSTDGLGAGAFRLHLSIAPGAANWGVAASLSCKPLLN